MRGVDGAFEGLVGRGEGWLSGWFCAWCQECAVLFLLTGGGTVGAWFGSGGLIFILRRGGVG